MFITEIFLLSSVIASMANETICRSLPTIVLPKFVGSILREGDVIFADTAEDEAAGKVC